MHAVVQDAGVERRVKLDAGHLPAEELAPGTNAVDMVMFDGAERSAHMADDRVLPAIMNHVVAHDMRADESLLPSDTQPLEHRFELVLVTGLALGPIPFVVACFLAGAQADARAFDVMDEVALDNPSGGPVRSDGANLMRGGRRPLRGGLTQFEPADRDVVHVMASGEETGPTHRDFHAFLIGIGAMEIRVQHRTVVLDPGVPYALGHLGIVDRTCDIRDIILDMVTVPRRKSILERGHLIQRPAVEEHHARMFVGVLATRRHREPIAEQRLPVRIVIAEHGVVQRHAPDVILVSAPPADDLGPLDHGLFPVGGAVDDSIGLAGPAASRIDPFPIHAVMNDDDIAGHRDLRGMPYRPERIIRPTLGGIRTFGRNMVLHYNLPFHHSSAPPCADRRR